MKDSDGRLSFRPYRQMLESVQTQFDLLRFSFPNFAEQVLLQREDLAAYLQNLEARLMVQKLGWFCREHRLFWIPMHDGFIARMDQGKLIEAEASKIIQAEIGFAPQMECTPLHSLTHPSQSTITGD